MKIKTIELDIQAKKLATDYIRTESRLLNLLMEMKENHSFRELECSGIFEYCEKILKLSRAQSYYFKSVAEKSKEVPELKKAIDEGILSLSQARRIVSVLTPSNHKLWIEKASTLLQPQLEREVAAINPQARSRESLKPMGAKTSKLVVEVDSETEESLKILQDILSQKTKKPANLKSVIAWAVKECREKYDPIKKAERTISKSGRNKLGGRLKDLVSSGNKKAMRETGEPSRKAIPNSIKAEVVLRDGWQCSHQNRNGLRCTQRRWLDFHHVKEVAKGGLNEASNLTLRCKNHHQILHEIAKPQNFNSSWSYWWNLETRAKARPGNRLSPQRRLRAGIFDRETAVLPSQNSFLRHS